MRLFLALINDIVFRIIQINIYHIAIIINQDKLFSEENQHTTYEEQIIAYISTAFHQLVHR